MSLHRTADDACSTSCKHAGVALCTHMNTAFFDGKMPDQVWFDGGLVLLARCDAVWAIAGWEQSEGARLEVAEARRLGMPVLLSRADVVAFLGGGVGREV